MDITMLLVYDLKSVVLLWYREKESSLIWGLWETSRPESRGHHTEEESSALWERERTPTFVRGASVNMKQNSGQQRNVRNPLKPEERNTWKNLWQPYSGPSVVVVLTSKNGKPHASSTTQSAEWIPLKKGWIIRPTVTTIQVATKT